MTSPKPTQNQPSGGQSSAKANPAPAPKPTQPPTSPTSPNAGNSSVPRVVPDQPSGAQNRPEERSRVTITLISRSADSMNLQVLLGDPRQPITTSLSPGQQWVHTYDMAQKAGFSKLQVTDLGSGRTLVSEDITFNWPEQVSRTFYVERPSSAGSTDSPVSADTTESPAGQSAAGKDSRVTVTVISRSQAVMNLEMYLWPGRPDVYGGREAPFKVPLAPGEKWVHTYNVGPMSAMSFFSVADLDSEKRILEERIVWTQAGQQLERTLYVGGGDERK